MKSISEGFVMKGINNNIRTMGFMEHMYVKTYLQIYYKRNIRSEHKIFM
jgi:hypothetical protein